VPLQSVKSHWNFFKRKGLPVKHSVLFCFEKVVGPMTNLVKIPILLDERKFEFWSFPFLKIIM
jgi:hypothetical protein